MQQKQLPSDYQRRICRLSKSWGRPTLVAIDLGQQIAALYQRYKRGGLNFQRIADDLTRRGAKTSESKVRGLHGAWLLYSSMDAETRRRLRNLDASFWVDAAQAKGLSQKTAVELMSRALDEDWGIRRFHAELANKTYRRPAVDANIHVSDGEHSRHPIPRPTARLHLGDALEYLKEMKSRSVDIVLTSPPFNFSTNEMESTRQFRYQGFSARFAAGYQEGMPESEYQTWIQAIVRECLRISKGLVWVHHQVRYRDGFGIHPRDFLPFKFSQHVVISTRRAFDHASKRFPHSHQELLGFGKPHWWTKTKEDDLPNFYSVWELPPLQNKTPHPCPFDERLAERVIRASCPPGGVVLDPFCGIATAGTVAVEWGRSFIGIDRHADYVRIAREALAPVLKSTGQSAAA